MGIFKNRKAELVRDKFMVEMEEFSKKMQDRMNFSFDVMCERDNLKDLLVLEQKKTIKLTQKIEEQKKLLEMLEKENDKLFELLDKLSIAAKNDLTGLQDEITELKSNRYRVVKIKPTKPVKQKMGIKGNSKNSEIIKKVSE